MQRSDVLTTLESRVNTAAHSMTRSLEKKASRRGSPVRGGAISSTDLLGQIKQLIEAARSQAAKAVNLALVARNWQVGRRILDEILAHKRAGYGEKIVATLSRQLTVEYGKGFSRDALFRMVQFAETFADERIVATLSQQLGWSHFILLIPIDQPLKREFYAEMCRLEGWSVRTLRAKIDGMLFERTAISKRPGLLATREIASLRQQDQLTPDLVFKDPYLLDFLGLEDTYSESDLERAILRELEAFMLELGTDFSFVARQKRMTIDGEDYHLDLLFYHRRLRRLVAIELKLGKFRAADKGQMELYLRWLDANARCPGEESPIGLILCADKSEEHVALLRLEDSGIRVAQYVTELPPRQLLEKKLHHAIRAARARLGTSSE
jgi:predicted nuclease of restriction endonuclease-like (RecB) superfamily